MSADPFHEPDFSGANFEGELPADFAALGEQLQTDAQRLSSVYPACRPPTELIDALSVSKREWWMRRELSILAASAAAMLLVVSLVTIAYGPWSQPMVQNAADPTAAEIVKAPVTAGEVDVQSVSYQPVAGFNGPELEGLLDLLQDQPQSAATSISF